MKKFLCLLSALMLCASLTACGQVKQDSVSLFAMDTYMTLLAHGGNAADALTRSSQAINELEASLSRTIDTSDVAQLNKNGTAVLGYEATSLLTYALYYAEETDGCFDVTVAPLVELWGITSDSPRVPSQEEIDALLPLVGSEHIHQNGAEVTLDEGCAIDLGGIAKGYASDCVAALFQSAGIDGGCANLGGNVYVCGTNGEGKDWTVGIQDPQKSDDYACVLTLTDAFVVTSGGYQRNFTAEDGTVYQHIIDPKTGYPAESDLTSVSVVTRSTGDSGQGTRADAYSTALYVMGEQGAVDFWRAQGASFDMVLITADGRVLYTSGLADCFNEREGSGYVYEELAA